ncbi:unnamed protein product [Phaeothamnion confervicola]
MKGLLQSFCEKFDNLHSTIDELLEKVDDGLVRIKRLEQGMRGNEHLTEEWPCASSAYGNAPPVARFAVVAQSRITFRFLEFAAASGMAPGAASGHRRRECNCKKRPPVAGADRQGERCALGCDDDGSGSAVSCVCVGSQLAALQSCPWDESLCSAAASDYKIYHLMYTRENRCFWDDSACRSVAANPRLAVGKRVPMECFDLHRRRWQYQRHWEGGASGAKRRWWQRYQTDVRAACLPSARPAVSGIRQSHIRAQNRIAGRRERCVGRRCATIRRSGREAVMRQNIGG